MGTPAVFETLLRQALPDAEIQWQDPRGDGRQFVLTIAAPAFAGIDRLGQHRLVRLALLPAGEAAETIVVRTQLPDPSFPLS